jgi:hypothetical protein
VGDLSTDGRMILKCILNRNVQIKNDKMGGACRYMAVMRNAYKILVGKPEENRPIGRRWCRWRIILKWTFGK